MFQGILFSSMEDATADRGYFMFFFFSPTLLGWKLGSLMGNWRLQAKKDTYEKIQSFHPSFNLQTFHQFFPSVLDFWKAKEKLQNLAKIRTVVRDPTVDNEWVFYQQTISQTCGKRNVGKPCDDFSARISQTFYQWMRMIRSWIWDIQN